MSGYHETSAFQPFEILAAQVSYRPIVDARWSGHGRHCPQHQLIWPTRNNRHTALGGSALSRTSILQGRGPHLSPR